MFATIAECSQSVNFLHGNKQITDNSYYLPGEGGDYTASQRNLNSCVAQPECLQTIPHMQSQRHFKAAGAGC